MLCLNFEVISLTVRSVIGQYSISANMQQTQLLIGHYVLKVKSCFGQNANLKTCNSGLQKTCCWID